MDHQQGPDAGLRRARYEYLVNMCDEMGVVTPEHPFPVWTERGGPATIVPMFLLYDYWFLPAGATSKAEGLAIARERNVVCTDEFLLSPSRTPPARHGAASESRSPARGSKSSTG